MNNDPSGPPYSSVNELLPSTQLPAFRNIQDMSVVVWIGCVSSLVRVQRSRSIRSIFFSCSNFFWGERISTPLHISCWFALNTHKLLTGCLGIMAHNRPMPRAQPEAEVIMKAIIPRQPVNNSYIY